MAKAILRQQRVEQRTKRGLNNIIANDNTLINTDDEEISKAENPSGGNAEVVDVVGESTTTMIDCFDDDNEWFVCR